MHQVYRNFVHCRETPVDGILLEGTGASRFVLLTYTEKSIKDIIIEAAVRGGQHLNQEKQ